MIWLLIFSFGALSLRLAVALQSQCPSLPHQQQRPYAPPQLRCLGWSGGANVWISGYNSLRPSAVPSLDSTQQPLTHAYQCQCRQWHESRSKLCAKPRGRFLRASLLADASSFSSYSSFLGFKVWRWSKVSEVLGS